MVVVFGQVIGDPRDPGMNVGPAQVFGAHLFTGCGPHQWRPAEEDRTLVAHDNGLVGHSGNIGATGSARTHDYGDLWDAGS